MIIHAIETGKVKITKNWRTGRGDAAKRLINTLFDSEFTEWLPIYVWVIEHSEGLIVIDTGIPADANKRIWFPPFMPPCATGCQIQNDPGTGSWSTGKETRFVAQRRTLGCADPSAPGP
ncbi:MAG: hypothetical protein R3281_12065 [Balneolaceae bacterium]|nr:hypothetical protein [Balneolaceae bacterium]